jgi:hypothetical protein
LTARLAGLLFYTVFLFSGIVSCAAAPAKEAPPDPSVFYQALKAESAGGAGDRAGAARAAELYEKALDSPSFKIRREAARKLGGLLPALSEAEDQAKRILKWLERAKKNEKKKPEQAREVSEPSFVFLRASALYVTGGREEIVKLYAGKTLSPREQSLVILSRPETPRFLDELRALVYSPRESSAGAAREHDEIARGLLRELEGRDFSLPEADSGAAAGRLP